jgi:hypothetical protein
MAQADVLGALVGVLGSPQTHNSIKREALQAAYNLLTLYAPSRYCLLINFYYPITMLLSFYTNLLLYYCLLY